MVDYACKFDSQPRTMLGRKGLDSGAGNVVEVPILAPDLTASPDLC